MLLTILALPLVYLGTVVALFAKRRRDGVVLSLLCVAATFAVGTWAIMQSRGSTAGIGFLFLPALAAVSGGLALVFGGMRRSPSAGVRALGLVALLAAVVPPTIALRGGLQTIARNRQRDAQQTDRDVALALYREQLDSLATSTGGRMGDTLATLILLRRNDRELVLAALERKELSVALLDSFARSPDPGVALQAVRNPNTASATLTTVYRTATNRMYFLQTLAGHPNTPPSVLREIHSLRPAPITGLDIWFAGNPSSPRDVLLAVARTSDSIHAVRALLRHPTLDCAVVEAVAAGPAVRANPGDADVTARIAEARASRCG